jgi:sugar lactone lactonase YvrE
MNYPALKLLRKAILLSLALYANMNSNGQTISTLAGTGVGGYSGDGGPATAAKIYSAAGIAVDGAGNVYFSDANNHRIRKITPAGTITTIAGIGTGAYSGDGGAATAAQLKYPRGVTLDGSGSIYISDNGNYRIRKIDPAGIISTVAGTGVSGFSGDGGPATAAQVNDPGTMAMDAAGNLYIADQLNYRIRKIDPAGMISTFAGTSTKGYSGDGGPAVAAQLNEPSGVGVDAAGNVLIVDFLNNRIRRVDASGTITTFAGTGIAGYTGDCGQATAAQLANPSSLAVDGIGDIYITDEVNHSIRRVNVAGIITTVAGTGISGYSGDGGPATLGQLNYPYGIAASATGNIYISDQLNNRVRLVSGLPPGITPITGPASVCTGAVIALTDATSGGAWSSGITSVASVSSSGMVTGISAGTVIITYLTGSGCGASGAIMAVTVNTIPVAGSISGTASLCPGNTTTLTETVSGGIWSSSNSSATISGSGVVTAASSGLDTIQYIVANTCGADTAVFHFKVLTTDSCMTTGTIAPVSAASMAVYPNPGHGTFTINVPVDYGDAQIFIIDVLGKKVSETAVAAGRNTEVTLSVPAGVYFLTALSKNERTTVKLIIE